MPIYLIIIYILSLPIILRHFSTVLKIKNDLKSKSPADKLVAQK